MIKQKTNPWEGSFENLATQSKMAIKIVAKDIKDQVIGEPKKTQAEEMGVKEITQDEKKSILTNQALRTKDLEHQIKRAREDRIRKAQERLRVKDEEKKQKMVLEQKKQEEPVWKKMMKMGSDAEKKVNAGG